MTLLRPLEKLAHHGEDCGRKGADIASADEVKCTTLVKTAACNGGIREHTVRGEARPSRAHHGGTRAATSPLVGELSATCAEAESK